jgi:hypothetical protein
VRFQTLAYALKTFDSEPLVVSTLPGGRTSDPNHDRTGTDTASRTAWSRRRA